MLLIATALASGALLAPASAGGAQPTLSAADREHYKNAFLHFDRGNYRDAHLHAARASDKLMAKVVRWLLLTAADRPASYTEARTFYEQNPDWPRRRALQRAVERAMPSTLADKEVLSWFAANPAITVEGATLHIAALVRAGKVSEAHELARKHWREGAFDKGQEQSFLALYGKVLTRDDHIARLDRLLYNRSSGAAMSLARRIGKGYPELAAARLALARRKPGVDGAIRKVPKSLRNDVGLIYERARWRKNKDLYSGVVELLAPLPADAPNADRVWPLRFWATREAIERRDYKTAYRIASNHGLEGGSDFAEAEWLAGWTSYSFLKQPKTAYTHFTQLYYSSSSPISLARGAYWAGEAATAMGKSDWADRWYRTAAEQSTTFYGQLASSRLGHSVSVDLQQPKPPSTAERKKFDEWELVRIAHLLGDLDQVELQQTFLYHLRDLAETESDYELAAALAIERRRPDIALSVAKRARNDGIWLSDQLFPMPTLHATSHPEHALVLAVVRQESAFHERAISYAGARGLMQLMPATAKHVARSIGIRYSRDRLIKDANYNLRIGRAYLAELLERFGGSEMLALAGYNAGPHRVSQWIRKNGDPRKPKVDPVEWIERIPFSETRNYVMRVLESLVVYRHRMNSQLVELPLAPR